MAKLNSVYVFGLCLSISFLILTSRCIAPSTVRYGSPGAISHQRGPLPFMTPEELDLEEKVIDVGKIDYYRRLMAQGFEFVPPIRIVVVFPPPTLWLFPQRRSLSEGSLRSIFCDTLSEKLSSNVYVKDVILSAQVFNHYSFIHLQEIGARYRADQCLIVDYNLTIRHPSMCLGFWPLNYKQGGLSSEIVLLDTRTGFVLMDRMYSLSRKSSSVSSVSDKEKEIIFGIISEWTALISEDILDFYRSEGG